MRVLVLNRLRLKKTKFSDWLGADCEVSILNTPAAVDVNGAALEAEQEKYNNFYIAAPDASSNSLLVEALSLAKQHPFDQILAFSEFDLLQAARLRKRFGIEGQDVESATAFRDKAVMKKLLSNSQIPVAQWQIVDTVEDLYDFWSENPDRIIVKPRKGMSSVGIEVIESDDGVRRYCEKMPCDDSLADLMVEVCHSFKNQYHVDGLIRNGEIIVIWPSITSPLLDYKDGLVRHDRMMGREEPLYNDLVDLTRRTLNALPTPENTVFHCEIISDEAGNLLVNEIASRIPGLKILDMLQHAFEINFIQHCARWQCGLSSEVPIPSEPCSLTGYVSFPKRPGTVGRLPSNCPLSGVIEIESKVRLGQKMGKAVDSSDRYATLLVAADTSHQLKEIMQAATKWWNENVEIFPD